MTKKMVIMLVAVGILFGGIFGYKAFGTYMMKKYMAAGGMPPVTVSTVKAASETWQPRLKAVGTLRAVQGVDVSCEIEGIVKGVHFTSGDEVRAGQVLVQLNADTDLAQLQTLKASAELARSTYERYLKLFETQAISQAEMDAYTADFKAKTAQVVQQEAVIAKKTIRAPFAGRLGISSVNSGQYLNPGAKIVTLQALDTLYIDFTLPQQELSRLAKGQAVAVTTDTFPGRTFEGTVSAVNPKVDPQTRNVQAEAVIKNPGHELLPGMYASVEVQSGSARQYLTLPRTAVTFNPYGETVYLVEEKGRDKEGKPALVAVQKFVTVGPDRGDQVAILTGIKEGDLVVTSGQLKLKSGSPVIVNNQVQPSSDADPKPVEQ
ncbi:MAG TPA: efflux RND transporter periplasmic adaptor subunit [Deltaproteobacteria bacterium]|nr:efflux RND transporter periplasmic adaptor subunit [Deltaproteobacteria bacterium]HPR56003.1 efflux RND transporter periplasmic adaptor subunit [Deltaproteobacteria bacterium]HXK48380.1 efflux RND transporter periplasmic adaptor subunit [Deltaproteobacteria bacterium]